MDTQQSSDIKQQVQELRELFADAPGNVLVLHLTASKPGQISFKLSIRTDQNLTPSDHPESLDTLVLSGTNRPDEGIAGALKIQSRIKILHAGGTLTKYARATKDDLR